MTRRTTKTIEERAAEARIAAEKLEKRAKLAAAGDNPMIAALRDYRERLAKELAPIKLGFSENNHNSFANRLQTIENKLAATKAERSYHEELVNDYEQRMAWIEEQTEKACEAITNGEEPEYDSFEELKEDEPVNEELDELRDIFEDLNAEWRENTPSAIKARKQAEKDAEAEDEATLKANEATA